MTCKKKEKQLRQGTPCIRFASVIVCDGLGSPYSLTSGYWERRGGKLKARLLASSPNRWLLGRSHRLRHEACEVSAAIRTVTGRRCRGPSCGPRSKGTGRWVGGRAHLLDKQPRLILLPLLGAFLSMSGLHNENMAL